MDDSSPSHLANDNTPYVTARIGGQMFGFAIDRVHDVFITKSITRVPLAPRPIAGVLHVRGRIVTAIDMHARLGWPEKTRPNMSTAIVVEHRGESFGLCVDEIGDVVALSRARMGPTPLSLNQTWVAAARDVYRLEGQLLIILDVDKILRFDEAGAA